MNENHIDIIAKILMNENNRHFSKDKWFEEEEFQPHKITLRINQDREDFGTGIGISNKKKLFTELEKDNYIVRHQINPRRVAYYVNYVKLINEYLDYLIENSFNINRYAEFEVDEIKKLKKLLDKHKDLIYKRDRTWKSQIRFHDLKLMYDKITASFLAVNVMRGYGRVNVAANPKDVFSKVTDGLWEIGELGINGEAIRANFLEFTDHAKYILDKLEKNEKL